MGHRRGKMPCSGLTVGEKQMKRQGGGREGVQVGQVGRSGRFVRIGGAWAGG